MAIHLASKLGCEILSADSRQIYRELNIGVARPEPEELAAVKHHFIGHISITESYSAGRYGHEARIFAEQYFQQQDHLVLCGGTGLYLKAFLDGLDRQAANEELRQQLQKRLENEGLENLSSELKLLHPETAASTDLKNPRRVLRALEIIIGGQHQDTRPQEPISFLPESWQMRKFAPAMERQELYHRINQRTEQMLAKGLWEEAEALFEYRELNALQTVGYREIFDCMEGKITRLEAIEKIKQHTRNYAKRQLTWFRRDDAVCWITDIHRHSALNSV
jgi:tRNA dimethylallyltransferase